MLNESSKGRKLLGFYVEKGFYLTFLLGTMWSKNILIPSFYFKGTQVTPCLVASFHV